MFSIFSLIVISYEARVPIKIFVVVVSFIARGVLKMYLKRTLLNLFLFHIREIYSVYMHEFVLFILTEHLGENSNK